MSHVVIVEPGDKLPTLNWVQGDFADWVAGGMHLGAHQWSRRRPHEGDSLPETPAAIVVTGSGAMVTDDSPWIRELKDWLAMHARNGVPIMGICFGHQVLASALGGIVRDNPAGIEVGTVETVLSGARDTLFRGLPERFPVQVSHRQSVIELPSGAVLLASSAQDPHHAFRWGERCWGIQFHPEFDARMMPSYIGYYEGYLLENGVDVAALRATVADSPLATGLLARFREITKKTPVW